MLYGQLQANLCLGIIKSPSVSGALNHKGICMASKHEEQREAEIRRHHENGKLQSHSQGTSRVGDWTSERLIRQNINSSGLSGSSSISCTLINKCCYVCNQVGHLTKKCKTNGKEQESQVTSGQKMFLVRTTQGKLQQNLVMIT